MRDKVSDTIFIIWNMLIGLLKLMLTVAEKKV